VTFIWREVEIVDSDGVAERRMAMVPQTAAYARLAAKQYHVDEDYPLVPLEARSLASHNAYFAELNKGFDSLPEDLTAVAQRLNIKTIPPDGFVDSEHFRAWALCETGHCDVTEFDFDSVKDARVVAKFYRARNTYCQILVRGAHVTIKEAKSQSAAAMSKEPFEASKRAVLDLLETMLDVAKGTLKKEARRA
jgi:hypothetical protein